MDLKRLNFDKLLTDKQYAKTHLNHDLLEQLTTYLGHLPVIRNDEGKVSATQILKDIKDTQYSKAMTLVYSLPRGSFYTSNLTQTKSPTLGGLTPIPMYALKRDKGIMYEEWDKSDPWLKYMLGKNLDTILKPIDISKYNINDIRHHYTTSGSGAKLPINAWPKKVKYEDLDKWPAMILAQLWIANASLRKDSMILDLNNWDNMPEALDEVIFPQEKEKEEELPWI